MDRRIYYRIELIDLEHIRDIIQQRIYQFSYMGTEPNVIYLSEYLYHYLRVSYNVVLNENRVDTLYGLEVRVDTKLEDNTFMLKKEGNMRRDDCIDSMRYAMDRYICNDIATTMELSKKLNTKLPKHYIINKGATILFWEDGTKTVIKRSQDDEYDKIKGFLWAYFQKHSGLSRNKANKYLAELVDEDDKKVIEMLENEALSQTMSDILNSVSNGLKSMAENMIKNSKE